LKPLQSAVRNPRYILSALIVILALAARLIPGPRTIDDSFITFRYARNLLAGSGFTYNPGQPAVLGTTTPLYTLLMAGLGALSGGVNAPFPELALVVNALADAATCLLLAWLGRRAGAKAAGWAAAVVWAVAPFSVTFAIGGLETSLYVLLLTGTMAAALAGRRVVAALLGALALLTRPDALILLGPLVIERLIAYFSSKHLPNKAGYPPPASGSTNRIFYELLAFGLPVLAWGLFATLTFGSPLPNSILAKAAAYHLETSAALIRLIQHYATPFLEQNLLGAPAAIVIGIVLYPTLFLIGARQAWKVAPRLLPWMLYPWLYLVTFALPNPLIFRWYLTPPLPAYFLFILLGLEGVLQKIAFSWKKTLILGVLFILPLAPTLSDWRIHPDHGPDRPAPEMAFIKLELLYRQAAAKLFPLMDEHSLLAAGDVGVLGFYTPGRILDTVGLNSPVSTRYYPLPPEQYAINYAIPAQLILDQQPDFVVLLEVYGRSTLLKDSRFLQEYHLLEKIDTDMYGSDGMLIFMR
jgi:arabinofuranosyltransferase